VDSHDRPPEASLALNGTFFVNLNADLENFIIFMVPFAGPGLYLLIVGQWLVGSN